MLHSSKFLHSTRSQLRLYSYPLVPRVSLRNYTRPIFQELDGKWQKRWAEELRSSIKDQRPKSYVLPMFAYPSGSLHMGHLRVYTISDVIARYRRTTGHNVLHPTGWDAFGLPAENAAIERGISPENWTEDNIAKMKSQLKSMNTSFDWSSEISTCSPSFYKHTQRLFLMLFRRGLAYQADALVNYDPVDKTVLANEQVDNNGRSWRSGAIVQQINLKQWFFQITAFKEALLKDLDYLAEGNKWPDRVISQQRNWLGKSNGATIQFDVEQNNEKFTEIQVFTTRPETLFGVKYLALSLSHPLVQEVALTSVELQDFLAKKSSFSPASKEGFELPFTARNPLSQIMGHRFKEVPVYVAPYVLEHYGAGAVMGVPGHDSRDLAFWKVNRPMDAIDLVIQPSHATIENLQPKSNEINEAFTGSGILTSLCSTYAGLKSDEAAVELVNELGRIGLAQHTEVWKLRDWLISRQRYWGTPIPIIHCPSCGVVPVPEADLPVQLPVLHQPFEGYTGNPLENLVDWTCCTCPQCHGTAKRETDTMDTFVDSSWYFLRFADPENELLPFSKKVMNHMLPVDTYIGGVEHAILHLLYARFMYKFLSSEGLIETDAYQNEPFQQLIAQGMVHGKTLSDPKNGRFLLPQEVEYSGQTPTMKVTGEIPAITWEKMSKSKHNGVDPSSCIQKYGADATRAHILFAAPVGEVLQWDEEKIIGIQRWFGRISRLVEDYSLINHQMRGPLTSEKLKDIENLSQLDADILIQTQNTIKSVSQTFEKDIYSLNTVVSDLTKFTNGLCDVDLSKLTPWVTYQSLSALLRMLAPIAPAFMEECWELGKFDVDGQKRSIFDCDWPKEVLSMEVESKLLANRRYTTCAVQINGKLRFTTQIPAIGPGQQESQGRQEHEVRVIQSVLASEPGNIWFKQKYDWEKRKRVLVIRGGQVLNVVF